MQDPISENKFIAPYRYPPLIILTMIIIWGFLVHSLRLLPISLSSVKEFNIGIDMYNKNNYEESIKYLESVLQKNPQSKNAKIAIAKAYFVNKNPKISVKGLSYLHDVRLDNNEWNELNEVMPAKYHQYFSSDPKKR